MVREQVVGVIEQNFEPATVKPQSNRVEKFSPRRFYSQEEQGGARWVKSSQQKIFQPKEIQSGASSRAKHGGAYFSAVRGSMKDPIAVSGRDEVQEC